MLPAGAIVAAMTSRAELHDIIDVLPESELASAQRLLQALPEDLVLRALLAAPLDDEPVPEWEREMLDKTRESLRAEGGISTAELLQQLGL